MKQQVYNLKEFAALHHLESIFGAYAAHIYIDDLCENELKEMALERTLFTKLVLVTKGNIKMQILQQGAETDVPERMLIPSELLVISPKHVIAFSGMSADFEAEAILVDEEISADVVYQLSADKQKAALDIFHMIRDIVQSESRTALRMASEPLLVKLNLPFSIVFIMDAEASSENWSSMANETPRPENSMASIFLCLSETMATAVTIPSLASF